MSEEGEGLFCGFGTTIWKKVIYAFLFAILVFSVALIGGWDLGNQIVAKLIFLLLLSVIFYFTIVKHVDVLVSYALIITSYILTTGILYVAGYVSDGGSMGIITNLIAIGSAIFIAKDGLDKADIFPFFIAVVGLLLMSVTGILWRMDLYLGGLI